MRRLTASTVLLSFVLAAAPSPAADFSGWNKNLQLAFKGYTRSETLTDFPALIIVGTNIPGFAYNQMLSTNYDLRFTDNTQTNELNYQIDYWDTNGLSYAWVRLPQLTTANTTIWMYWGKSGQTQQPYMTNGVVWSNGFGAVWHLSEDAGLNNMSDSAGATNNNLTFVTGNRVWATGKIGKCLSFDTTNYWSAARQDEVNPTNGFTLSAWIYRNVTNAAHSIIEEYNWLTPANSGGYLMRVLSDNKLLGDSITNSGTAAYEDLVTGTSSISALAWNHVAVTLDTSAHQIRAYVNGTLEATATANRVPLPSTNTVKIGASGDTGNNNRFNGLIDEPRIDTVPRSSNWLWACYMNQGAYGQFVTIVRPAAGTMFFIR
jgi:hypothetical protein